jgi:hypothetical protein
VIADAHVNRLLPRVVLAPDLRGAGRRDHPAVLLAEGVLRAAEGQGASRAAAIRAPAFKWIRILHRCWLDRQPYDESRYRTALKERESPVQKFAAGVAGISRLRSASGVS